MKVVIEFDDENPDDRAKLKRVMQADELCYFIATFQQHLRSKWKYGEYSKEIDDLWQDWHNMMSAEVTVAMEDY
jgi:hypothetical protein